MADDRKPKQKTPKGKEIPLPKKQDVLRDLRKASGSRRPPKQG